VVAFGFEGKGHFYSRLLHFVYWGEDHFFQGFYRVFQGISAVLAWQGAIMSR
jgi:hypothetical protein